MDNLNSLPGPNVHIFGNCRDMSQDVDGSEKEITHRTWRLAELQHELVPVLWEAFRGFRRSGLLRLAVPDLEVLCKHFLRAGQSFGPPYF